MSSRKTLSRLAVRRTTSSASNKVSVLRLTSTIRTRPAQAFTRSRSSLKNSRSEVTPEPRHSSNRILTPLKSFSHSETGASANMVASSSCRAGSTGEAIFKACMGRLSRRGKMEAEPLCLIQPGVWFWLRIAVLRLGKMPLIRPPKTIFCYVRPGLACAGQSPKAPPGCTTEIWASGALPEIFVAAGPKNSFRPPGAPLVHDPQRSRRIDLGFGRFFNHHECRPREPAALDQSGQRGTGEPFVIRRVEEGEGEGRAGGRSAEQSRVGAPDARDAAERERFDIGAQQRSRFRAVVDEQRGFGAARQRLDSQRAGACKEVDDARALDDARMTVSQNIEDRFA